MMASILLEIITQPQMKNPLLVLPYKNTVQHIFNRRLRPRLPTDLLDIIYMFAYARTAPQKIPLDKFGFDRRLQPYRYREPLSTAVAIGDYDRVRVALMTRGNPMISMVKHAEHVWMMEHLIRGRRLSRDTYKQILYYYAYKGKDVMVAGLVKLHMDHLTTFNVYEALNYVLEGNKSRNESQTMHEDSQKCLADVLQIPLEYLIKTLQWNTYKFSILDISFLELKIK